VVVVVVVVVIVVIVEARLWTGQSWF